eukprot:2118022-Pyramimonas_sp.AAC.1
MKLRVANKSIVMCSHHPGAIKVVRALRLSRFHFRAERYAGYLGSDLGRGGRRVRSSRRRQGALIRRCAPMCGALPVQGGSMWSPPS